MTVLCLAHRRVPTIVCLSLLLGLLVGCATSAPPPSLFVLDAGAAANGNAPPPGAPTLVVAPVVTAAFLDQGGIVYQTAAHRVVIANDNRWASPLSGQLTDGLYTILNRRLRGVNVIRASGNQKNQFQLQTRVDQFLGQYDGKAHITGRWTLIGPDGKDLAARAFTETIPLETDGYPALVTSLSTGWQTVGRGMASALEGALPSNGGS